jgi:DNA (cytosine-5)-methyltransferase 1
MDTIRYIDLFCGLGAFHTAFLTNPKFQCVFASDIDKGIQKIYKDNYGIDVHGDIRSIQLETFPAFDLLCAGFPCQPFSIAGNGEGFNDQEKGNLFYEILKLIDKGHPKMCILENVKNLKTHDNGNTYTKIETELQSRGYLVTSKVLNAVDFGSPQARQRIFIVATKNLSFPIPDGTGIVNPVNTIVDPTVHQATLNLEKYELVVKKLVEKNIKKPKLLADVLDKQTKKGGRQGERVYDPNHVGITVCASSGGPGAKTGLYKIGSNIRRLTVKETLGMFGFPSTYNFGTIPPESCLFYLGNSIVVDVVKAFVPRVVAWFAEPNGS